MRTDGAHPGLFVLPAAPMAADSRNGVPGAPGGGVGAEGDGAGSAGLGADESRTSGSRTPEPDSQALIERVQVLTERLEAVQDEDAREVASELVSAVLELYGEGLSRIWRTLSEAGEGMAATRDRLLEDGVVSSLLLIHDLFPVDLEARVARALDSVRPYMESHGGSVELLGIEEGVARLRLEGSCRGCPSSSATLEQAIRQAVEAAAPDLAGLEVEGA